MYTDTHKESGNYKFHWLQTSEGEKIEINHLDQENEIR